jgi:hypothetical protein
MRRPLKVLTPYEAKIAGALARTMYPRSELPPDHLQQRALEYVDAWMLAIPARERTLIRLMFVMFELSMPLFGPSRTKLFSQAEPEHQRAYLATWESSNLYFRRIALSGLRSVLSLAYFADADVQRLIGVQDGVEVLARQRARVADRPGPDIDPAANVMVIGDAVEAVRAQHVERERRERESGPAAASGGES